MPYWNPLKIGGTEVSLAHLEPHELICALPDGKRQLAISVTYSNHCFSIAFDPALHKPDQILQEEARPRVFDQARYDASKGLPGILKGITNGRVQLTPAKNYYYHHSLAPENDPYDVFFNLKRNMKQRKPPLVLYVESAYINDEIVNARARPQSVRFSLLAEKIAAGKRLKFNWR